MIKKITLILLLGCIMFSCGKKADPVYKESKFKNKVLTILVIRV